MARLQDGFWNRMIATASFDYNKMVDQAMRSVMRQALTQVATTGLPGDHHFYISFSTTEQGVQIPDFLLQSHPEEMTVVLQHQFWDLSVDPHSFSVTLSFSGKPACLTVPFNAVTSFADPFARFGLQFQPDKSPPEQEDKVKTSHQESDDKIPDRSDRKIVALDAFRRKSE